MKKNLTKLMILYGIFLNNIEAGNESEPLTGEILDQHKADENDISESGSLPEFDEYSVVNSDLSDDFQGSKDDEKLEILDDDGVSSAGSDMSDVSSCFSDKDADNVEDDVEDDDTLGTNDADNVENDDTLGTNDDLADIDQDNAEAMKKSLEKQENKRKIDAVLKAKLPELVDSFLMPNELQAMDIEFEKQLTQIANVLTSLNNDLQEKIQQYHNVSNALKNDKDILLKTDEAAKKAIEAAKVDSKKQEETAKKAREEVVEQEDKMVRLIRDECNIELNNLTQQVNDKVEDNKKRSRERQDAQNELASQIKDCKSKKKSNAAARAKAETDLRKCKDKVSRAEVASNNANDASDRKKKKKKNKLNKAKKELSAISAVHKKAVAKENKEGPIFDRKIEHLQKSKEEHIKTGKEQEVKDRDELEALKIEVKKKKDKLIEQRENDVKEAQENAEKEISEQTERMKYYHTKYEVAKNAKSVQDIGRNELAQGYQALAARRKDLYEEIKFLKNAIHKCRNFQKKKIKSKDLFNEIKTVKDNLINCLYVFSEAPSIGNSKNIQVKAYELENAIQNFTRFSGNNQVMPSMVRSTYDNCAKIFVERVCKFGYIERLDGGVSKIKSDFSRFLYKIISKVKHKEEFIYDDNEVDELKTISIKHISCPDPKATLIGISTVAADTNSELGALGLPKKYPSIFEADGAVEAKRSNVVATSQRIKDAQALKEQGEDRAKQSVNHANNMFNKETLNNIEQSQERAKKVEASINKNALDYSEKLNDYKQVQLEDHSEKIATIGYGANVRNAAKAKMLGYHQKQGISGSLLLLNNFTNEDVQMIGFKNVEQIKNAHKEGLVNKEGEFTSSGAIIIAAEKGFVAPVLLGVVDGRADTLETIVTNGYLDPISGTYVSSKAVALAKEEKLLMPNYNPSYFDELKEEVVFAAPKKNDVSGLYDYHIKINVGSIMYANIKKINRLNIACGFGIESHNSTVGLTVGMLIDYKIFQSMIIINPFGINISGIINGSIIFDPVFTWNIGGKINELFSLYFHVNLSRSRGLSLGVNGGMVRKNIGTRIKQFRKCNNLKKLQQMSYASVAYIC